MDRHFLRLILRCRSRRPRPSSGQGAIERDMRVSISSFISVRLFVVRWSLSLAKPFRIQSVGCLS
jgi:hypothetical protein